MAGTTATAPRSRTRRWRRAGLIAGGIVVILAVAALWQRANPFTITTSIVIDAPPEDVWAALVDFERYEDWNPTLVGMTGDLEPGGTLRFSSDATDDALTFEPTVLAVVPDELIRWEGSLFVTGLFDGEHNFVLHPTDDGETKLVQYEKFRGITVPFLTGWLDENTRPDFIAMNEALKLHVESGR